LMGATRHSDFHPTVSLKAPRDRFAQRCSTLLESVHLSPIPVMQVLGGKRAIPDDETVLNAPNIIASRDDASAIIAGLQAARHDLTKDIRVRALLDAAIPGVETNMDDLTWTTAVAELAAGSIGHFPPEDLGGAWISPQWIEE